MATYTDKLGLIKPAGTDPFLLSDFNDNTDAIDRAPGVHYCTSSTRPSWGTNEAGRLIVETDTKKMFIWPGSGSFVEVVNTVAATANTNANTAISTANSASGAASTAYTLANDTSNKLNSLTPIYYQAFDPTSGTSTIASGQILVAAGQNSWSMLPDSPPKGTTFVAPASGKVTIQVSGQVTTRTYTTGLSYILRTGSSIGSGTIPSNISTNTPASTGAALTIQGLNSATDDTILGGSGKVGYHSGLTPGATYNVAFAHYNSNSIQAYINYRSMLITPLP